MPVKARGFSNYVSPFMCVCKWTLQNHPNINRGTYIPRCGTRSRQSRAPWPKTCEPAACGEAAAFRARGKAARGTAASCRGKAVPSTQLILQTEGLHRAWT